MAHRPIARKRKGEEKRGSKAKGINIKGRKEVKTRRRLDRKIFKNGKKETNK